VEADVSPLYYKPKPGP